MFAQHDYISANTGLFAIARCHSYVTLMTSDDNLIKTLSEITLLAKESLFQAYMLFL